MTEALHAEAIASARRLMPALAASVLVHTALLAGVPVVPGGAELSLFASAAPLRARLAMSVDDAAPEAVPLVPPVAAPSDAAPKVAAAPVAELKSPGKVPDPVAAPESQKAAGLPGGEIFYKGSEVDVRAEALNVVDVRYPESALAGGVRGVVRLRLLIDSQGRLRDASVMEARPAGVFENAALEAAMELRFRPALRQGVPVGSIKVIEVPFDPDCNRTGSCNN